MKRNLILGMAILAALAFVSCKSTESSYKKAYDKARQQEQAQQATAPVQVTPVVTPVQTVTPVVAQQQPEDNSDLRTESLTAVSGTLNAYNVVCGSFKSLDNANNLCSTLKNKGYSAIIAQNPATGMYRVIATSSSSKSDAVASRDKLRSTYPDAWLLYAK
ncbi:MAG: SPOR domain-containing protein [Bacteroidaceae bacterium]|jgi:cell division septation protein DedD|nr:SPOR domain-containing protein [Bacteroidaceae bacterium]